MSGLLDRPYDTTLAIEAAQRLADYALEHGADDAAVHDDLLLIGRPIRLLQEWRRGPLGVLGGADLEFLGDVLTALGKWKQATGR